MGEKQMYVVLLRFAANRAKASQFMAGHNEWLRRGFDAEVFLLAGSLQDKMGGGILAHNVTLAELQERVDGDPFVVEQVVSAEIIAISPARADDRLAFLLS
jgi:uncharacterized protein YciI